MKIIWIILAFVAVAFFILLPLQLSGVFKYLKPAEEPPVIEESTEEYDESPGPSRVISSHSVATEQLISESITLISPNGTPWKITVSDSGELNVEPNK